PVPPAGRQGTRRWTAARSLPSRTEFDGQVVARWVLNDTDPDKISGDEDAPQPCLAIDDGSRTWSFGAGWQEFHRVSVGDLVRVEARPRTGELLTLTRLTPAPAGPIPVGPVIGEPPPEPAAGIIEAPAFPAALPLSPAQLSPPLPH